MPAKEGKLLYNSVKHLSFCSAEYTLMFFFCIIRHYVSAGALLAAFPLYYSVSTNASKVLVVV